MLKNMGKEIINIYSLMMKNLSKSSHQIFKYRLPQGYGEAYMRVVPESRRLHFFIICDCVSGIL